MACAAVDGFGAIPCMAFRHAPGRLDSVATAILASIATASSGYLPMADSPESMTQSVPSRMALATSVDSARVGRRLETMDSSIWVAVMTGLPAMFALKDQLFLNYRDLLDRHFNPEVAAGHHDAVGCLKDIVVVLDGVESARSSR